ncbi:MAG TPA: zinc ribbon domain-containing protein, partial [Bryobacteraceae bacterium]|nr:zinc ribbon domain-containing protein [Bryobacteraceae bacterium]
MSDYCTCGAELPPDARFCHKCGKPQREELVIVEEPPAAPPPPPPVAAPIPIGFRNPLAFRVGFLSALMALLLTFLLTPGLPLWLTAAGFLGVYLYRARSGETFSTRNGARMGWLTGVLAFLVFALPAVLGWRAIVASPEFVALMR